jgi:hypothetical protein
MRIVLTENYTEDDLEKIILKAEQEGVQIERPESDEVAVMVSSKIHELLRNRYIGTRNKTSLNNDKINNRMHSLYMERRRNPKQWTYTNIVSPKTQYFPDSEEVEMMGSIIGGDLERLSFHLRIAPWVMRLQESRRTENRKKTPATRSARKSSRKSASTKTISKPLETTTSITVKSNDMTPTAIDVGPSGPRFDRQPRNTPKTEIRNNAPAPFRRGYGEDRTQNSGSFKTSYGPNGIFVQGKIWCDSATKQKLECIIPFSIYGHDRDKDMWSIVFDQAVSLHLLESLNKVMIEDIYGMNA